MIERLRAAGFIGEVPGEPGAKSSGHYRFDQSVFGQPVHSVIVDSQGKLVRTRFGKRFSAETCDRAKVAEQFPTFESEFGPIDRFPNLNRSPLAN